MANIHCLQAFFGAWKHLKPHDLNQTSILSIQDTLYTPPYSIMIFETPERCISDDWTDDPVMGEISKADWANEDFFCHVDRCIA